MNSDSPDLPIWLWQRRDDTWKKVMVSAAYYARVADLARGPNGDAGISLVEMPLRERQSAA